MMWDIRWRSSEKQIEDFMEFATNTDPVDSREKIKAHLEFENFRGLNSVAEIVPKRTFIKDFYEQNENSVYLDLLQQPSTCWHRS